jgi:signal transduction histidine kinase
VRGATLGEDRRVDRRRPALAVVAVAYAVAAVVAVPRADFPVTTYAATSDAAHAADLAAGLALLAAGALTALVARGVVVAALATLAGVAWFGPDWVGWEGGPVMLRSLGAVVAPFVLPLLVHLVLAAGTGRVPRAPVATLYAITTVVTIGRALFRDPFADPECWTACGDNAFLLTSERSLVEVLDAVWWTVTLAAALALAGWSAWALLRATPAGRRVLAPVLVPGVVVGLGEAAYAAALLAGPTEDPSRAGFAAIFLVRASGAGALAAGVAWSVLRTRRVHSGLARLAVDLGGAPRPGALRSALVRALGDPTLEVAYAVGGRHIDADGRPITVPDADDRRATTAITREDEVLALVVHEPALLDGTALEREVGSAARLAVDNERMQAELLGRLSDVRASRARIVEVADAERRRLERDLHDGAQQRLLAVSYELSVAHAEARADGDEDLAATLEHAAAEARAANDDLRRLAQGIFPAILAEAGLADALESLADTAPLPLQLDGVVAGRLAPSVESAAYAAVADGVQDAARRHATYVRVTARRSGERLTIDVEDDGEPRASHPVHLADRAAALGGSLDSGRSSLRMELPCA